MREKVGDNENHEAEALKRHVYDAKKAIKTFIKQQKRSKILNLPKGSGSPSKKVQNPED
jgi:hypothetical protein